MNHHGTAGGRHPNTAITGARGSRHRATIGLRADHPVTFTERGYGNLPLTPLNNIHGFGFTYPNHAAVRAKPQIPHIVGYHLKQFVDGQTVFTPHHTDCAIAAPITEQAPVGCHPHIARFAVKAEGIFGILHGGNIDVLKFSVMKNGDPHASTHPNALLFIFLQRHNKAGRETVICRVGMERAIGA